MALTSNLELRRASLDDCATIAALLSDSFAEYKELYSPQAFAATCPSSGQIRTRIDEGPVWIALQNGLSVATVSAVSRGESLYVRSMAVAPAARGQNIGEMLLTQVEEYAHRCCFPRLVLNTAPFLSRAIRLYERFGFRYTHEGPEELFGTPLLTMVKDLGS